MELIDLLQTEAERLRNKLENLAQRSGLDCNLKNFPLNCCEHATRLMAFRLLSLSMGSSTMFYGKGLGACCGLRHVWLVHNGVHVDITSDQFNDELHPPVIVASLSDWHSRCWLSNPERNIVIDEELRDSHLSNLSPMAPLYREILEDLRSMT